MSNCPQCNGAMKIAYERRSLAEMANTCCGCGFVERTTRNRVIQRRPA